MPATELPPFGFGTGGLQDPRNCAESVRLAVEAGYRLVDGGQSYGNEAAVGEGIAAASTPREELFVSTKVWENLDRVVESVHGSLDRLGLDVLDMLYVHWPAGDYDPERTLAEFDELVETGLVRSVGMSNFTPPVLDQARARLDAPVVANQVEMHPLLQQAEMVRYAAVHDMYVVAYAPVAKGEVFDVPTLVDIAEKHDATAAQVSLAWLATKPNVVPIPRSGDPAHIRENRAAFDLVLDPADIAAIEAIDRERRLFDQDRALW
ncbi:MAG: aldo/keto reductase [Halobacteriaceae archaeon]